MKTLTSASETIRLASYRQPRTIIEIDWNRDLTYSGKYSDQPLTITGTSYLAYVKSWGSINQSVDLRSLGKIDDLQIVFKTDDTENFYEIYEPYDFEGLRVRVGIWFVTTAASDIVWWFYGTVNAVTEVSADGISVDIVEFGLKRSRELPEHDINATDFPDAPSDSIGKKIPIIFGAVEKVPAMAITAAHTTELYGELGVGDVTIRVYDASRFAPSGTILIGDEQITYTGILFDQSYLGAYLDEFIGCTRGAAPPAHHHGDTVTEKLSAYKFLVADHACKAVNMVRVNKQLVSADTFSVDVCDESLVSGRNLAVITFTAPPKYFQQSSSISEKQVWPDTQGTSNINGDYSKTIDEPEAGTFAEVTIATSPLVVKRLGGLGKGSSTVTAIPAHDAGLWSGAPTGGDPGTGWLTVLGYSAGWGSRRSYMRLTADQVPASYQTVKLKIYCITGNIGQTIQITPAAATWDESTITWNNQPNGNSAFAPSGAVAAYFTLTAINTWYEITIPNTVDLSTGIVLWAGTYGAMNCLFTSSEGSAAYQPYFQFYGASAASTDRVVKIYAAIEFSTSASYTPGDLQIKVIKGDYDTGWLDLWSAPYSQARPAWDTKDRQISQSVAEIKNDSGLPLYNLLFTSWSYIGNLYHIADGTQGGAVDGSWDSYMILYHEASNLAGKLSCTSVKFVAPVTPPAGTIKKVRCAWMGSGETGSAAPEWYFYLGGTLLQYACSRDMARFYSEWIDVSENAWDMETVLTNPNTTYVLVTLTGGTITDAQCRAHMAKIEVQYEPTEAGEETRSEQTVTNFVDLMTLDDSIVAYTDEEAWRWFVDAELWVQNVAFAGTFRVHSLFFEADYLAVEQIESNEVSCDVQGIETLGTGAGTLLQNPADIIKYILLTLLGFAAGEVDSTAFTAAATSLTAVGAIFGFALLEATDAWQLIAELAYQARCWFRCNSLGKYGLYFRPSAYSASIRTLSGSGVTGRMPGTGKLQPFALSEISNDVTVLFDKDYSATDNGSVPYKQSVHRSDESSQTKFGIRQKTVEAWAVRSLSFAESLVDYILSREKNARALYIEESGLGNCDIEPADIIAATDARWDMTAATGEVVQIAFTPGAAAAKRANKLILTALVDPYDWFWGDSIYGVFFSGGSCYFVIAGVTIARLTATKLYLKGDVIELQTLNSATASPLAWNASVSRIQFTLSDQTALAELDASGNLHLLTHPVKEQSLTFAGMPDTVASTGSMFWINIGSIRALQTDSGNDFRLAGHIVSRAPQSKLL